MEIDEMILKANVDGKTYFCNGTVLEYSKEKGFIECGCDKTDTVFVGNWREKPKRHLTVSEAEKELDCEIDTPDISKLFKLPSEITEVFSEVILVNKPFRYFICGHYDFSDHTWRSPRGTSLREPTHWINPADLIKLLPKE